MVDYSISATSLLAIASGIATTTHNTVNAAEQQSNLRQYTKQDTSTHQQRKLITLRYGDTEGEEYHGPSAGSSYLPVGYGYEPSAPHSNHDKIDFVKPVADAGHDQWTSDGWEKKHSSSSSSSWSSGGWGKKEHHDGAWKCNSNLLKRWSSPSWDSPKSIDEWGTSSWSTGKSGKSNSHGGKSGKSGWSSSSDDWSSSSSSGKSGKSGSYSSGSGKSGKSGGLRLGNVSGRKLYQYDVVEVGDEAHTSVMTSYGWGVEEHKSWSSSSDDWSSSSSSSGKSGKSGSWSTGKSGKSGGLWSSEGKSGKSGAGSHYGGKSGAGSYHSSDGWTSGSKKRDVWGSSWSSSPTICDTSSPSPEPSANPTKSPSDNPTSQPTEDICTCAPKAFDITWDFTNLCFNQNTLLGNPGIDSTSCTIVVLQDNFDIDDMEDMLMDPPEEIVSEELNLSSNYVESKDEVTRIFGFVFGEFRLGDGPFIPSVRQVENSEFSDGSTFSLTSIADDIDPEMSIFSQLENVPVSQVIRWVGETANGSFVFGALRWFYDNDCGASDLTAILDGDEFGKLLFNQVVEQPFDYCLVPTSSPSISSMPSSMPSNQPSSQPSQEPTDSPTEPPNTPLIKETPEPTVSPVTPFPTISPTGGSTPTVGKDISTPPTMLKRTSETDVEQEASNDLANLTLTEKVTKDCVQHYDEAWSTKRNAVVTGCVNVCEITTTVYQGDVEKSSEVETTKEICDNRGV